MIEVFLSPATVYKTMGEQTKAYLQSGQKAGSPHIIAAVGMLTAVVKEGEKIGAHNLKVLGDALEKWTTMSLEEVSQ